MSELPWVRFFASDWLGGTRGMTAAETGIYITLVAAMYERGTPIPDDGPRLARLCGASNSMFKKTLEALISEGKIIRTENGLWNNRVKKEVLYRSEKSQLGKQASNARWGTKLNENNGNTYATALPMHSERNASQIPETKTIEKKERLSEHLHPGRDLFAEFWMAYPRREGSNPRKPAKVVFDRLLAKGVNPERLIAAAKALAVEHPTPTRFVPQAGTFLNQERYDDAAPVVPGDTFCASDDPSTRFHVIRFHNEHDGLDPPSAAIGGKAGYMIPAEWVKAMQLRQANG